MRFHLSYAFVLSFFIVSCASKEYQSKTNGLTVMTYNVENLFDALDDKGKEDETYLPLSMKKSNSHKLKCQGLKKEHYRKSCLENDWNETKISRKLGRLADVVKQVKKGQGPDVLIMQEVENLSILTRFKENHLKGMGYKEVVLIEGPDKRGIDIGMISKLRLKAKPQLHEIDLKPAYQEVNELSDEDMKKEKDLDEKVRPTRGILQAQFALPDGKSLTIFGVHFPSQGSKTPYRKQALATLEEVRAKLPKNEYVIAAGDFNITMKEDSEKKLLTSDEMKKHWLVSHLWGCEGCDGTHNYRGEWSFLDVMLFSHNFKYGSWRVNPKSIRIPNKSIYQVNRFGNPARYRDGRGQLGVSDHWPLAVDLEPKEVR